MENITQIIEDMNVFTPIINFSETKTDEHIVNTPNPTVNYDPNRDLAAQQLYRYKLSEDSHKTIQLTTITGAPIGDDTNILTVGPRGPQLMEDGWYQEEMAHFDRERIPERVVHAKGAGAFGYFEVTNDEITNYCKSDLFSKVGKRTPIAVRFSTVAGESGSADTVRDPRGFSIKFYTNEGNLDLVGNNTPVFFIRDPFMFISFIHSQKRNNQTHLIDYSARWDFFTLRHEALHQITWLFGDKGIPDGFRHMDGWSGSALKLINHNKEVVFCQFYWKTNQGIKNLDPKTAQILAAKDPDYALHDLFDAIEKKDYPSWTLFVQVMTYEEAEDMEFNPFDITKVWPESRFPLIEVGKFFLDRNPMNYFAQVEQMAFDPANIVPGIGFSPDKMLHGRLFAYKDTARHRLGPNHHLIPVNCPLKSPFNLRQRDGQMMTGDNMGNAPSYFPNSFSNATTNPSYIDPKDPVKSTDIYRFESKNEDNYTQVRDLYLSYSEDQKQRLYNNIANELSQAFDFIQVRAYDMFSKVHEDYGEGVKTAVEQSKI